VSHDIETVESRKNSSPTPASKFQRAFNREVRKENPQSTRRNSWGPDHASLADLFASFAVPSSPKELEA
jgi:hypothetical protein